MDDLELEDPFLDPAAVVVFGAPGRVALVHQSDGTVRLVVESLDGDMVEARLDPEGKGRLVAALETLPPA